MKALAAMNEPNTKSFHAFLRKVPVLSGLVGPSLASVAGMLRQEKYQRGDIVFTEGELGRTMYVLFQGEVNVLRNNEAGEPVPIVRLGPGECFGEMALVELGPRSASVVATAPTTLYSLNNLDLYRLFHENNYAFVIVLQNICRLLSRRLRKADGRLAEFLSKKAAPSRAPRVKAKAATKVRRRAS